MRIMYVCYSQAVPADKLTKKGRVLAKTSFLPADEIDANMKFEVFLVYVSMAHVCSILMSELDFPSLNSLLKKG